MELTDIAVRLAGLHESGAYHAARFDPGEPFSGRVAVLPSAYNPPTRAHLGLLELGLAADGISMAAALLTTNNVDKSIFGAPLSHRVGMLLAARQDTTPFAVLGSNAARISDQGHALAATFPGTGFDFVVGYDTLIRLFDRKYYEEMERTLDRFFSAHRLIATNRAQMTVDAVTAYLDEPIVRDYRERILVRELDERRAALSSSAVRLAQAEDGRADEGALVPSVQAYIHEHRLYDDAV